MITLQRYSSWWGPGSPTALPEPLLWMEYASSRPAGTLTHNLIGGGLAVTHRPAGPRRVRVRFLYDSEDDARTCETEHARGGFFQVSHDGRESMDMTYVVPGDITRTLDPETASMWIVELDAQEVRG